METLSPVEVLGVSRSRSAGCLAGNGETSSGALLLSSSRPPWYPISPRFEGNGPACCGGCSIVVVDDDGIGDGEDGVDEDIDYDEGGNKDRI